MLQFLLGALQGAPWLTVELCRLEFPSAASLLRVGALKAPRVRIAARSQDRFIVHCTQASDRVLYLCLSSLPVFFNKMGTFYAHTNISILLNKSALPLISPCLQADVSLPAPWSCFAVLLPSLHHSFSLCSSLQSLYMMKWIVAGRTARCPLSRPYERAQDT